MRNDPRVAEAMRLHKLSTRSHHVWQTLRALGEQDERAQAAIDDHTRLLAYLAAEFDKVPSAPVEAVSRKFLGRDGTPRVCEPEYAHASTLQPCGSGSSAPAEAVAEVCSDPDDIGDYIKFLKPLPVGTKLYAATPPQSGKTENEIDRLETEVARLTAELQAETTRSMNRSLMYQALADAMDYDSGRDGMENSPEEWAKSLLIDALKWRAGAAELQEVRKDAWQPIETAPKDGSEFIAWWVYPGGPMGAISTHWLDNTNSRTPWAGWRAPSMRVMHPGGKPIHWMPLPKAPSAAITKEKP